MGAVSPISLDPIHKHTLHTSYDMTGSCTYILVCKRSNIADTCEDSSNWAPDYHRIPRLARVSQQQHVQQGVWKSLQLIKACKHRDLHAPCPSHQRLTAVCCSAACCKVRPSNHQNKPFEHSSCPLLLSHFASVLQIHLFPYSWFTVWVYPLCSWCVCVCCTLLHGVTVVIMSWRSI